MRYVGLTQAVHPHPCHAIGNQRKGLVVIAPDEDNYLRFTDEQPIYESIVEVAVVSV